VPKLDVVIIGAGAAGIAAARDLHEQGVSLVVCEARERIGGRVWTHRDPRTPIPIELGAEFIHGSAPEIEKTLGEAKLTTVDIAGKRWMAAGTRWTSLDDFWQRLYRVMHLMDDGPALSSLEGKRRDRSVQAFLDTRPGGRRLARDRMLARQFVEGFHAADTHLISAKALAASGTPGEDVRGTRLAHVVGGYDRLIDWLAAPVADRVRLGAMVTRVTWSAAQARVEVRPADGRSAYDVDARAVLVTVPIGVLQAPAGATGAIAFEPGLGRRKLEALDSLAAGSVVRVGVHLRERIWASEEFGDKVGDQETDALSFLHSNDPDFNVWWTAYPVRAPVIIGWRGGPGARRLAHLPPDDVEARAIASLARHLRMTTARMRAMVEGVWTHNWELDPFARGAYSYQRAGAANATDALARPLNGTLFFAGEATGTGGSTGTVDGAIATGRRAAKQLVRALGKR
jgi:monoamine oxidase